MQNFDSKKNFITKIVLIILQAVATYQILHFSILENLLLVYLFVAILFKWSGGPLLIGGIGMLVLTTLLKKTRPGSNVSLLEAYQLWIVGAGIILIAREWFEKKFKNVARNALTKIRKLVALISRIPLSELRPVVRRGIIFWFNLFRTMILETVKYFWRSIVRAYNVVFGHFSLSVKINIMIFASIMGALFFGTNFTIDAIVFLLIFTGSILFAVDSRFSFGGACISLAAALVLFFVKNEPWARVMADYAYYFLAIGVTVQMAECFKGAAREHSVLS